MSVPTEKVNFNMNLESVLGESLQHYGVLFVNRMSVNFVVTDTKLAIMSVRKGCGNGSMTVSTPDGRGKIINDKRCIEHVQPIMGTTPGFDTVYDRGAYVLDIDVNGVEQPESDSGMAFPVIRKEYWEKALSQAQHEHERKQVAHHDVHGENQKTFEQVKVKVPPEPYEPTKQERQSHEATHCPFRSWCEVCVNAKSPDGRHTKQLVDSPVIEFDNTFAADIPGDPSRNSSMMVATDSIHGSIFAVVARRKGGQDDFVIQSFQKLHRQVGSRQGRVEM